jgi:hypothetical protein
MTTSTVAPAILSFAAIESGSTNVWTFSGSVAASNPAGLVVKLGGLSSLQGKTCTINSDGTFAMTVALQPGESGTASAQFVDWSGIASNIAYCQVQPIGNISLGLSNQGGM